MRFLSAFSLLVVCALAPVFGQSSTLNLSTDLVSRGAASANMVPNQPSLDSAPLFESAVRFAVRNNITRVVAEPGAYYFRSTSATNSAFHVAFPGPAATAPALTIDLQGSDLYLANADKGGIFITGGANLTLQNFTVDYSQLLYTQVQVTAVNATTRQVQFTVAPGWQSPTALNSLLQPATGFVYFFRNGQPWVGYTRFGVQQPFSDSTMTILSGYDVSGVRVGDVGVLHARTGSNTILASAVANSTLKNIKIYSGMVGVRLVRCSGMTVDHVEVVPKPGTDRLVSTMADGFQPQQLGLDNTFRLCRAIRTCDDGFSPSIFVFGSVQSTPSTRTAQIQGDAATALAGNNPLPNGTNVVFQRASDGAILGSAVLVSQVSAPAIGGLPQAVLTFDRDLPAGIVGSYVYATDASWRGGGLLLEKNTVQHSGWARGITVWGIMNGTLAGNYIRNAAFAGIDVRHPLRVGDWITPPAVNLVLSNNVVDGAVLAPDTHAITQLAGIQIEATNDQLAPMTTSPHQNISLKKNFVADPGRSALLVSNVAGGSIESNYLFNPNNAPNTALADTRFRAESTQPLVLGASQGVSVTENVIDLASRRAFVSDTTSRDLAAYGPGATIRFNALNLGTAAAPSLVVTDSDGRWWSLAPTAPSAHALDVQLPTSIGLGAATVAIKAGGASWLGTFFIDNQDNGPALNQPTFGISPGASAISADGGTISFLVVTASRSSYPVTSTSPFVIVGNFGIGSGVITAAITPNTGAARSATVEIAGQSFTINQAAASDLVLTSQPQSVVVKAGESATFAVTASGAQGYQWSFNGAALPGATGASVTVANVSVANVGTYTVAIRGASGTTTSNGALLVLKQELPALTISRLTNLSILTTLSTDNPTFTLGTAIGGAGTTGGKPLLIRAAGPALAALGVPGTLNDPKLDVFSGQTVIASNDNWGGTDELSAAFAAVGAFGYPAPTSRDAAVFNRNLAVGNYTVQVSAVGNPTGTVIAEFYDSTPDAQLTTQSPRLINVSVLKQLAASEALTAGFVIAGPVRKSVLIRVVGPTLGLAPFNIATAMADPKLELYDSNAKVIASNDDWGAPAGSGAATPAQLSTAFSSVGAFSLPADSRDAALLITLPPGNYTARASANSTGGHAIIEVYEVP